MKFYELEPSIEYTKGNILKLRSTVYLQEGVFFWGMIATSADNKIDFLVLLNMGIIERINNTNTDRISTTEDEYQILRVYKNTQVRLE